MMARPPPFPIRLSPEPGAGRPEPAAAGAGGAGGAAHGARARAGGDGSGPRPLPARAAILPPPLEGGSGPGRPAAGHPGSRAAGRRAWAGGMAAGRVAGGQPGPGRTSGHVGERNANGCRRAGGGRGGDSWEGPVGMQRPAGASWQPFIHPSAPPSPSRLVEFSLSAVPGAPPAPSLSRAPCVPAARRSCTAPGAAGAQLGVRDAPRASSPPCLFQVGSQTFSLASRPGPQWLSPPLWQGCRRALSLESICVEHTALIFLFFFIGPFERGDQHCRVCFVL